MSEATAKETAERCCEAALAALERGDADKAQRLAEKAMRLAPSDEVRREMKGGEKEKKQKQRSISNDSLLLLVLLLPPQTAHFLLPPSPPLPLQSKRTSEFEITGPQSAPRHQVEARRNGDGKRPLRPKRVGSGGRPPPQRPLRRRRRFPAPSPAHPRAGSPHLPRPLRRLRLLLDPRGKLLSFRNRGEEGVPAGGAAAAP